MRNNRTSQQQTQRGGFQQRGFRSNKKKQVSTINPDQLVKKAAPANRVEYTSSRTFDQLPISDKLKAAIQKKGYSKPTEIQDKSIEHILAGHDFLGIARTGTGKTGAFLIPIINNWITTREKTQALVIVPTRELAVQVEEEFKSLTHNLRLFSANFIGGTSVSSDLHKLKKFNHLIVGTPGRLMDLLERRALNLSTFSTLVIDEFDRMLDMGFAPDVLSLTEAMRGRKQTLLFSATINKSQASIIKKMVNNPVEVRVSSGDVTSDNVEQNIIRVKPNEDKFKTLYNLINHNDFEKVLIFAETKRGVSRLCGMLQDSGIRSEEIHGNKSQGYRQRALDKFRVGKVKVLVATDVAARGLDIRDVTHVINYQLPMNFDSYIHRIGRTGRAGKSGKAFTFVD
jgi:ATP-dependent RNA helicase RhlE